MKIKKTKIGSWLIAVIVLLVSGCVVNGGVVEENDAAVPANSPSKMAAGDIMFVDMSDEHAIIDFKGVASGAEFTLVIGTSDIDAGGSFRMVIDGASDAAASAALGASKDITATGGFGSSGSVETSLKTDFDGGCVLSSLLRAKESLLASSGPRPELSGNETAPFDPVSVGETRTFKVLFNLNSDPWTHSTVRGEAKCVGTYVSVFIDNSIGNDLIADEETSELCDSFDGIAEDETMLLGEPSDVNNDGLVTVLMTPRVNRLTASLGGGIAGYFFSGDLYGTSGANAASNEQEIIFVPAPDPNGRYGDAVTSEHLLGDTLASIFAHELQHAISYSRHVFVSGGPAEEEWLNEGLSRFVEDIVGYGNSNLPLYSAFLADTSPASLTTSGIMSYAENGGIYLFLRYLYEQAGDGRSFIAALVGSDATGVENLEKSFASNDENFNEFREFMAQWSVALAMNNHGLTSDARYRYLPPSYNSDTDNMSGVAMGENANYGGEQNAAGRVRLSDIANDSDVSIAPASVKYFGVSGISGELAITAEFSESFAALIRTK